MKSSNNEHIWDLFLVLSCRIFHIISQEPWLQAIVMFLRLIPCCQTNQTMKKISLPDWTDFLPSNYTANSFRWDFFENKLILGKLLITEEHNQDILFMWFSLLPFEMFKAAWRICRLVLRITQSWILYFCLEIANNVKHFNKSKDHASDQRIKNRFRSGRISTKWNILIIIIIVFVVILTSRFSIFVRMR